MRNYANINLCEKEDVCQFIEHDNHEDVVL